jgi:4-alpha-glucanotransferase
MAVWWARAEESERAAVAALPSVRRIAEERDLAAVSSYNPIVRDTLLEALFASGSNLLLLPLIDVFGWSDRINDPATMGGDNWTYRLPWPSDRLNEIPAACERQETLAAWARKHWRVDRDVPVLLGR